jgi:hypothetical protein
MLDIRLHWIRYSGSNIGGLSSVADHYHVKKGLAHSAMGGVLTTANILEASIAIHGVESFMTIITSVNNGKVNHGFGSQYKHKNMNKLTQPSLFDIKPITQPVMRRKLVF